MAIETSIQIVDRPTLSTLNEDCLIEIFRRITNFQDLVNLSSLHPRWARLMTIANNKIECLLSFTKSNDSRTKYLIKPADFIATDITKLAPNVTVLDVNFKNFYGIQPDDLEQIALKNSKIRGIICEKTCIDLYLLSCFPNLEMLVCTTIFHSKAFPFDLSNLRQLYIRRGSLRVLSSYSHFFTKLERLHLNHYQHFEPYTGNELPNLKILEYDFETGCSLSYFDGFDMIDLCPSLESAYLGHCSKNCEVDRTIINYNLRDLVIQQNFLNGHVDRLPYEEILGKYPNLLHLAIRNANDINDSDIINFVKICPYLELIDTRGSEKITEKTATFLEDYCKRKGRSILFLFGPRLEGDVVWPNFQDVKETVAFGFDFMENCFHKQLDQVPVLLVP